MRSEDFISATLSAVSKEALKKLVLSRPQKSEIQRVNARLCAHRGKRLLAFEFMLPGNTVSHKNVPESEIHGYLSELLAGYKQANLITTLGEVEWKISKSGREALLGFDAFMRKLEGGQPDFERSIEALDKKKNYILKGNEEFLIKLGISDSTGRVHDKKQGKFRQINRFLDHIEDVYTSLPKEGDIKIYDLCCGKSYLSFAVYYYLTEIKLRTVKMLGIDLKRDVIAWCSALARQLQYTGMTFVCDDINNTPENETPDMVISLHACDIATDIVLNAAIKLGARVILSTPCCHRYINDKIDKAFLGFITAYPHLTGKLGEVLTDAIRAERLKMSGYSVSVVELTDPENTPKNTLIRAIKQKDVTIDTAGYEEILKLVLGDNAKDYLKEISK